MPAKFSACTVATLTIPAEVNPGGGWMALVPEAFAAVAAKIAFVAVRLVIVLVRAAIIAVFTSRVSDLATAVCVSCPKDSRMPSSTLS